MSEAGPLAGSAPLQTVPATKGAPAPVVKESTGMAIDRSTGQTVQAEPLVVPKDIQWGKTTKEVDAGVIAKRAAGVKGQTAMVTTVVDGDGAKLRTSAGKALDCRIDMIDAPETKKDWLKPPQPGQPGAEQSTKSLKELIENKEVTVYVTGQSRPKDGYKGRSYCQIEIQGIDVGMQQIRDGMAYVYDRFVDKAMFPEAYAAQEKAKAGKLGVHAGNNTESSEQYRRKYDKSR